tara:strand:+ start:732 stop:1001 length:270 start_codon:yes stop_codon:yes gene_type:complete
MKFKPHGSWIVVPDPIVTETKSGIILDEETAKSNAKKSNVLKVIAAGDQCHFVKKGDTVMIDPRTEAVKAPIDGKNYLLINEHQILGKW